MTFDYNYFNKYFTINGYAFVVWNDLSEISDIVRNSIILWVNLWIMMIGRKILLFVYSIR